MKLIIISRPHGHDDDAEVINRILQHDGFLFHLRKPKFSLEETKSLIQQINPLHYERIVLHDHYQLAQEFGLKGVCVNKRSGLQQELAVAQSMHTLNDELVNGLEYVLLSPVFDSISKSNYKGVHAQRPKLTQELLAFKAKNNTSVMALGGIDLENIAAASRLGFDGVAVLGYLWRSMSRTNGMDRVEAKVVKLLNELKQCEPAF